MEAAQVAPLSSSELDSADNTQALLKTFAWVEPPEDDTCCTVLTEPPQCNKNQQFYTEDQKSKSCVEIISSMMQLDFCSVLIQCWITFSVDTPTQNGHIGRVDGTSPDVSTDQPSCASIFKDSSFEVISLESRWDFIS